MKTNEGTIQPLGQQSELWREEYCPQEQQSEIGREGYVTQGLRSDSYWGESTEGQLPEPGKEGYGTQVQQQNHCNEEHGSQGL